MGRVNLIIRAIHFIGITQWFFFNITDNARIRNTKFTTFERKGIAFVNSIIEKQQLKEKEFWKLYGDLESNLDYQKYKVPLALEHI